MSRTKTALLAGAAFVGLISAAQAEEGNWYGSAALGANWIDDQTITIPGFTTTSAVNYDDGWVMTGAVGYRWDYLRLEFELGYRENHSGDIVINGAVPLPDTLFTDVTEFSQMINLIWDIPLGDSVALSLGGGAGGVQVNVDGGGFFGISTFVMNDDDYVFAYQAIAGVSVDISDHMELFAEYRYFATDDIDFSGSLVPGAFGMNISDDLENQSAMIGVRYHFLPPAAPVEQPPVVEQPPAPKTYIVFFDFNKSNLTAEAQSVVAEAAEAYKATGSAHVQVVGHTDTVGSASYNQRLSERRAATVKAEMVRLGIPADAIATEGRGFSDPMVPTGPGVREPQNRRAVIDLQ